MSENKVIRGRENICKKYEFGKSTFYWLIEKGAPIVDMNGTYMIYTDTFEEFMKKMTVPADEQRSKTHPLARGKSRN